MHYADCILWEHSMHLASRDRDDRRVSTTAVYSRALQLLKLLARAPPAIKDDEKIGLTKGFFENCVSRWMRIVRNANTHAGDLQLERKTHLHKKLPTYQCIEIQWIEGGNEQTILKNQLGPEQCRYAAIMISWPLSKLSLVRSWTHFSTSPTVQTSRARRGHSSSFNHLITVLLSEWMTKLFSEGPVRLCGTDIATCPFGLQKDPEPLTGLYFWPEPCYTRFCFTKLQRLSYHRRTAMGGDCYHCSWGQVQDVACALRALHRHHNV